MRFGSLWLSRTQCISSSLLNLFGWSCLQYSSFSWRSLESVVIANILFFVSKVPLWKRSDMTLTTTCVAGGQVLIVAFSWHKNTACKLCNWYLSPRLLTPSFSVGNKVPVSLLCSSVSSVPTFGPWLNWRLSSLANLPCHVFPLANPTLEMFSFVYSCPSSTWLLSFLQALI